MSVRMIAVVTGAAGDIGREAAHRLARDGFHVVAADIDDRGLDRAAMAPEGLVEPKILDVTRAEAIADFFDEVGRRPDPLSVLVNGAGSLRPTRVESISEAEWDAIIDVNLKGTFLCTQAALPHMLRSGRGRIVNISSTAGKNVSTVGGAHYTAAKAAVLGLTRHVAAEVASAGVTVNAVCPGLIETAMIWNTISRDRMDGYAASFPIPRLGRPDEVASLIAFLVSREAAYITGASLDINGGDLMVG
jgi:NAD(P)-dependent dehydrogenase (short-subunit alcohol dehydrogenase family)